jgi:hypothetical protein
MQKDFLQDVFDGLSQDLVKFIKDFSDKHPDQPREAAYISWVVTNLAVIKYQVLELQTIIKEGVKDE